MNHFFPRNRLLEHIRLSLGAWPVTAMLGPRQSGKTSIARFLNVPPENYFDLEDDVSLLRLEAGPQSVLDRLSGLVVIDEIQRRPELFNALRVLADRPEQKAQFLILGSASPHLMRGASESLAGRVSFIDMGGFHLGELPEQDGIADWKRLWIQGGYPRAFLQRDPALSARWRSDYIRALAEHDIREMADTKLSSDQLRKLLLMVAHHHGQAWNHSKIASVLGVTSKTIQRHMEILKATFIIREMSPYAANVEKRLRKAPRYYFRDSGLLHALLGLKGFEDVMAHPALGASWEGFGIEQVIRYLEIDESRCFCYTVQSGTEMDLVIETPHGLHGFEFKASLSPNRTRSMTESLRDLNLRKIHVIYPGTRSYDLDAAISVVPITELARIKDELDGCKR